MFREHRFFDVPELGPNAGLPPPSVLSRAARRDVLDAWTVYSDGGGDLGPGKRSQ